MAINASMNWWVRAGGNELNGGGYDSTVANAGTNYANQDSPQLSLTDLTTAGVSATIGSVAGGFTSAMIGNVLRLASGTNFTAGYYVIVSVASTSAATLDRNCATAAGLSGVCRVGGAHASIKNHANGGTASQPALTSPLAAGHVVQIVGSGSTDPSGADYTQSGYYTFPTPNVSDAASAGMVGFKGVSGRPHISVNGLLFYSSTGLQLSGLKITCTGNSPNSGSDPVVNVLSIKDCIFDQNGQDQKGPSAFHFHRVECRNTGSTSDGTYPAISLVGYGGEAHSCYIRKWRGYGVSMSTGNWLRNSIIAECHYTGAAVNASTDDVRGLGIDGCSFYSNYQDIGVSSSTSGCPGSAAFITAKNCISVNATTYFYVGSSAAGTTKNNLSRSFVDFNAIYNPGTAAYSNISAGENDITLTASPFIDALNGDFRVSVAARGKGFPQSAFGA